MEKRDKFLLVENIPHPINIDDEKHIAAARDILEKSFRHKVLVDLAFSNLRTKADGTVTLVDFVEKPFAFEKTRKLGMFVLQFLKSWCAEIQKTHEANSPTENRSLAANLLDELTKNLQNLGFQPEWNEEALRHAFPVTIRIAG